MSIVETQSPHSLQPRDVVILDNLSVHKSAYAAAIVRRAVLAWLFLRNTHPNLNPTRTGLLETSSPSWARKALPHEPSMISKAASEASAKPTTQQNAGSYFKAAGYAVRLTARRSSRAFKR